MASAKRRITAITASAGIALASGVSNTARGQVVAEHVGDVDPESEGWTRFGPTYGSPTVVPEPAWRVNDRESSNGAYCYYQHALTLNQLDTAHQSGWRLSARLNVTYGCCEEMNNGSYGTILGFQDANGRYYDLLFGSAGDNLIVQAVERYDIVPNQHAVITINQGINVWHDVDMVFRPGVGADVFIDGVPRLAGYQGAVHNYGSALWPIFGAPSSPAQGDALFASVRFSVGCTTPPCFQGLGDLPGGAYFSIAGCLSSDGSTVGGGSATAASASAEWNHEAFIWRADTGMVYLGDLPGASNWGSVQGLSADGAIAVGASASGNGDAGWERREAFRWTEATGMVALGDLGGGSFNSEATDVSDDGALIAGWGSAASGWHAATWSTATGWVDVDPAGPHGRFFALSRNGEWAVGDRGIGNNVARRWSAATGLQVLGIPAGSTYAYPYAVSDNGDTVVGAGYGATRAFIWTPADGMQGLDDLPGGLHANQAIGITRDGRLIVGDGTSDLGLEAVLWDESRVVHRVFDVLATHGVGVPSGWVLRSAYDVVINGSVVTLCGYGDNPSGDTEAWIARYTLPAPPCPGDVNGDSVVDLSDLAILLANFGTASGATLANGDLDADGDVELADLALMLANFGTTCR